MIRSEWLVLYPLIPLVSYISLTVFASILTPIGLSLYHTCPFALRMGDRQKTSCFTFPNQCEQYYLYISTKTPSWIFTVCIVKNLLGINFSKFVAKRVVLWHRLDIQEIRSTHSLLKKGHRTETLHRLIKQNTIHLYILFLVLAGTETFCTKTRS